MRVLVFSVEAPIGNGSAGEVDDEIGAFEGFGQRWILLFLGVPRNRLIV